MVQVPADTSVTVEPDTVQTGVVSEEKLTGNPEEAVALTVIDPVDSGTFDKAPNVIVCVPAVTWKL